MALFPFGHGLSFTSFNFSDASVEAPGAGASKDDTAVLSVRVRNTGGVASAVTVQAYCSYLDSPRVRVARYVRMLCAFDKVFLQPAESTVVKLPIALRTLARWDPDADGTVNLKGIPVRGAYVIDAGGYSVAVGDCSGAGAAIGLPDAHPCEQTQARFALLNTIEFNGKH
jgi:beta-glucosidase